MKAILTILILVFSNNLSSQTREIDFWENNFCDLTIEKLRQNDPELKKVDVDEMNLCSNGFFIDKRFENGIGYQSKNYPGVIFQRLDSMSNAINKIHLTKDFKGKLPDGKYVDLSNLKAKDLLKKVDSLQPWTSRSCSNYWTISKYEEFYFYVFIDNDIPQYPFNEKYYAEQFIEAIDIVCYTMPKHRISSGKPIYVINGKEVLEETVYKLEPNDIESVSVLKGIGARRKYGEIGKNGVIEVTLKNKP